MQRPPDSAMANREFRGIVAAQFTSECGDQIAAIALSYLVYTRSDSAFLAAATYAVTFAPWVLGSVLLSPLVDRLPRRAVLVVCDLARAVIIGLLSFLVSFHSIPIPVLLLLVLISSCFSPPFGAARSSMLPDIFEAGPGYVSAVAIGRILQQIDSVFGFALGGVIVAAVSPRGALAIDSGTFLLSYIFTIVAVRDRPAAIPGGRPSVRLLLSEVGPNLRRGAEQPDPSGDAPAVGRSPVVPDRPGESCRRLRTPARPWCGCRGFVDRVQPFGIALGAWLFIRYVPPRSQGRLLLPSGECRCGDACTHLPRAAGVVGVRAVGTSGGDAVLPRHHDRGLQRGHR